MPDFDWQFTLVLLVNGVMIGLMYALIALGFVLIYKATDAINFAQGEFVMFAALYRRRAPAISPGCRSGSRPLLAVVGMVALGFGLERVVLRPMIGRPIISVIMATIGLAAVLRGTAVLAFGAGTRAIIDAGRRRADLLWALSCCRRCSSSAPASAWSFSPASPGFSEEPGRAWRCARSPTASRWRWRWASTCSAISRSPGRWPGWSRRLGGIIWGAMLGVDNQLALVGLKVFPVVILGGLEFDHRRGRRRADRRRRRESGGRLSRPVCRRRHQGFRALCADDPVLMIRPEGMFGRRRIERV